MYRISLGIHVYRWRHSTSEVFQSQCFDWLYEDRTTSFSISSHMFTLHHYNCTDMHAHFFFCKRTNYPTSNPNNPHPLSANYPAHTTDMHTLGHEATKTVTDMNRLIQAGTKTHTWTDRKNNLNIKSIHATNCFQISQNDRLQHLKQI